jgi:hypothetical protein
VESLIAANWYMIPDWLKLMCGFLLLGMTGWFALQSKNSQKDLWFEGAIFAHALAALALIGLISQVFHTGGSLYMALLLWSGITFFLAIMSQRILFPLLWTTGFLAAAVQGIFEFTVRSESYDQWFVPVWMSLPLFCFLAQLLLNRFSKISESFRIGIFVTGIVGMYISETLVHASSSYAKHGVYFLPAYVLFALVGWLTAKSKQYSNLQKYLIASCMGFFALSYHSYFISFSSSLALSVCTLLVFASMALLQGSLKNRKLFNVFLFLVGLRFLWLYFQALGGLATTGFGLITSGFVIVGVAAVWNRYRNLIAVWVEEKIK